MKIATIEVERDGGVERRLGIVGEDSIVDATRGYATTLDETWEQALQTAQERVPPSFDVCLQEWDRTLDALSETHDAMPDLARTESEDGPIRYDTADVRLLSPLPQPNSIRDFMAFEEHVRNSLDREIPDVWYELPVYYKGNPNSIVHPDETVEWPSYTQLLDYELEVAAVIGKEGRDIDAEGATEHIAGYTIFNDFSARDMQRREMQASLGPAKGKDFANGFGPYFVPRDRLDLDDLTMKARVNGDIWSEGNIGEMYHSFEEIIEHVSRSETLYPGDVLGSGTVGEGCGLELDRWIDPGDEVELEVEGLGTLRHTVGSA